MGKGDRRTKRGKIFRNTFGKRRPKSTTTATTSKKKAEPTGS